MAALQKLSDTDLQALLVWFKKNQRDFPWRKNPNPYWVWIAEIMSQQTVMAALLPYFYRFMEKFPAVTDLANASEPEVLSAWTGLGYYSRARNVHRAAKHVVYDLKGKFPKTFEAWLELPGVGPYTAAAISSQCYGVKEPVWDGNLIRVCSRLEMHHDPHSVAFKVKTIEALREKIAHHDASAFNQAFMELGATVCTPKSPSCGRCPISNSCKAFKKNAVAEYPPPKPRKAAIDVQVRVLVRVRGKSPESWEAWLECREAKHWFGGMWDFPSELGGVTNPIIPFEAALTAKAKFVGKTKHTVTHHKISLEAWMRQDKEVPNKKGRWISLHDLVENKAPVPVATTARKVLKVLYKDLTRHDNLQAKLAL